MSKKFKKVLRENKGLVLNPDFSSRAKELGIPFCPACGAPLLAGFGDSTGDNYLCLNCEAVIPMNLEGSK